MHKNSTSPKKIWQKFYKKNRYYHNNIEELAKHLVPSDVSVLEYSTKCGELLRSLPNKTKLGVEFDLSFKTKTIQHYYEFKKKKAEKYDYVLFSHTFSQAVDAQTLIRLSKANIHSDTKVIVFYFNFLWKPVLDFAEKMGLKSPDIHEPNWFSKDDMNNMFALEDFEVVKSGKRFIVPYYIPAISDFINKYISPLPIFNSLALIQYVVYRPKAIPRDYSVSIIIPARNEAGNMKGVIKKIPKLSKKMEIVFVEGHSTDATYETIENEMKRYKGNIKTSLYKQKGKGKGDAVRLGFEKASNDLLMILDADLTVDPNELPKFYDAVANGYGEFVMGSRLVYPMEDQAMRTLNYFGNKFFSIIFSFLLGQRTKDTLCGTKVLTKENYQKIAKNRKYFGNFDPFGDYDLIFGAAKLNLKIVEIPIRYKERTYGTTNISRFRHGFLLFQMIFFAAKKIKFV
jgi:hypothetical protein